MATVYPLQASFQRGEVTPLVHANVDTDNYKLGLAIARNWLVMRFGGLTRRAGTMFDNPAKNDDKNFRFIPFIFNETQAYAMEFGEAYIRFHTETGRVENPPGTPVEVVTPYIEADLEKISFTQIGDTVYLACEGYEPRKLVRSSETSWAISAHRPQDGPFLPTNDTATTLTPSSRGSLTPTAFMTNNTTPSGAAADSSTSADAYKAFDGDSAVSLALSGLTGWVSYTPPTSRVVDAYWIAADDGSPTRTCSNWVIEGYNGSSWVVIDTRTNENGWTGGETRFYEFANKIAFQAYRLRWKAASGATSTSGVGELGFHESGDTMASFNLTASSTVGINGGTGFVTNDVGRTIRLLGSDNKWRWCRVTARTSSTVVTVRLYGHALLDVSPIQNWRLSMWSDYDGYPRAVGIYQDRLAWAGTNTKPLGVALSRNSNYNSHGVSDPVVDDDGIVVNMSGGKLNNVGWMIETGELVLGTQGGIRILAPNDASKALSPANVKQQQQTAVRAAPLQPIMIDRTVLFAEKHLRKIYETAFTYEANGYVAYELTLLAEHLFWGKIRFMIYQDAPYNTLWVGNKDGTLVACTYDREQKVFGVSPVTTDGEVITGCVIPGAVYDVPMFGVRRNINGDFKIYIERMLEPYRAGKSNYDIPMYFDCAGRYQGTAVPAIGGADHLEGKTVGVYADGLDMGDVLVEGGVIQLPFEKTASDILYGLRVDSYARTLRLPQIGNRDGTGLGRKVRTVKGALDLYETAHITGGSLGRKKIMQTERMSRADPEMPPELVTGFVKMHTDDSWENGGVYEFGTDRNYPATVRALWTEIEGEP